MTHLEHQFGLCGKSVAPGCSKVTRAIVNSLKINSVSEQTRNGRRVFIKRRHVHGDQLAHLANVYFRIWKIPIRFQSKVEDWRRWEMKCFTMLNGDRFRVSSPNARTIIEDKMPGRNLWDHINEKTLTLPMLRAAAHELHRAHQFVSDEFGGGWSHGDATATNVIYDAKTERARLIDFEIVHQRSLSTADRQADDLLTFLLDMAGLVSEREWLPFATCFLEAYADRRVIAKLSDRFALSGGLAWIWWEVRTNFAPPAKVRQRLHALHDSVFGGSPATDVAEGLNYILPRPVG